ncbi:MULTISPECIES: MFS transporter [unclassified Mycobacterium]|uniref:MFS transporter n=1 Tax=unclassified Mycobacterium TaxID=2642494 RepID=UPI0029C8A8F6|nr:MULTISPECIES: MFS transporter [unclassified Mycobacterium]
MSQPRTAAEDAGALSTKQIAFMVAALVLAVISFQLNATMLGPAFYDIESELGKGSFAAMSTYFYLAGAVANVVLIRWSDYIGRKRVMLGILVLLCIGTLLCVLGTSLPVVVAGRIMQGACNVTFGLAFLIMRERLSGATFGVCCGVVSSINGGVAGVDALLGGFLADRFGYRSIFVLILVVGVAGLVFGAKAVPSDDPDRAPSGRMDWVGAALIGLGVAGLILFFSSGGHSGWSSPVALACIVTAIVALVLLVVVEKRVSTPLVDIDQMRSRQAWPLIVATILNMASFMVVAGFIVLKIAEDPDSGFGLDGTTTALLFLTPGALIQVLTAPLIGRLAVRIGFVTVFRAGILASIVATSLLAVFAEHKLALVVLMAVYGFAFMAMTMTTMSVLGVTQAPEDAPGSLPGISNAAFGIGSSLGFAWAGPVVGSGTHGSFSTALWICAAIGVVSLGASLILKPRPLETGSGSVVLHH